jgi:GNAT superfamily N-acetyltransferase
MTDHQATIDEKLNCDKDYLRRLMQYRRATCRGFTAEFVSQQPVSETDLRWMAELQARNMEGIYAWTSELLIFEFDANHFLIAKVRAEPAGFIHFSWEAPSSNIVLFINSIQVQPKYQHAGLGSALVRVAEEIARDRGVRELMTAVWSANELGANFFHRMKFKTLGKQRKPSSRAPIPRLSMLSKKLSLQQANDDIYDLT